MDVTRSLRRTSAIATAALLLGWPIWVVLTWVRYGRVPPHHRRDPLLDRFLPNCEAAESHEVRVDAPASITWASALDTALQDSAVVRAIVRSRELLMGAGRTSEWPTGGIVEQLKAWGWTTLVEEPGRAVVLGTVTQPWRGDVDFLGLSRDEFVTFDTPGYVKIVTAIAVEPGDVDSSVARVQTRVGTTNDAARARFRVYWSFFSPGIMVIRHALLHLVKHAAEARHRLVDDALPGDAIVPDPMYSTTEAVTIAVPPERVWPWIAQMGGADGADGVADDRSVLPGGPAAFRVAVADPPHDLVLSVPGDHGDIMSWEFVLVPLDAGHTSLVVRARVSNEWRVLSARTPERRAQPRLIEHVFRALGHLPRPVLAAVGGTEHRAAQRRQLQEIKERAEA